MSAYDLPEDRPNELLNEELCHASERGMSPEQRTQRRQCVIEGPKPRPIETEQIPGVRCTHPEILIATVIFSWIIILIIILVAVSAYRQIFS